MGLTAARAVGVAVPPAPEVPVAMAVGTAVPGVPVPGGVAVPVAAPGGQGGAAPAAGEAVAAGVPSAPGMAAAAAAGAAGRQAAAMADWASRASARRSMRVALYPEMVLPWAAAVCASRTARAARALAWSPARTAALAAPTWATRAARRPAGSHSTLMTSRRRLRVAGGSAGGATSTSRVVSTGRARGSMEAPWRRRTSWRRPGSRGVQGRVTQRPAGPLPASPVTCFIPTRLPPCSGAPS